MTRQKTRPGERLAYTGSLLGQNMIYSFVTMYVMFFFTDLLRIPSETVTVIVVVASLWDAVNDIRECWRPGSEGEKTRKIPREKGETDL